MFGAERVLAFGLHCEMIRAERVVTEVTLAHTIFATFLATLFAENGVRDHLPATWTFFETLQTVGFASWVALVKTRAKLAPTFATDN